MQLSDALLRLKESSTLAMARRSRELKASGLDIIDLCLGEPDFDIPEFIKETAINAIEENWSKYPPVNGFSELRKTISNKFQRDNGLSYSSDQIVVSTGAKQSLFNIVFSLLNAGDEAILPAPYWVSYYEQLRITDAAIKVMEALPGSGSKITPAQLADALSEKSKLFIFSSPCNPTGAVYSKAELEALAVVFRKYPECIVVSDEIYEHIDMSGEFCSIASLDGMLERSITVNGLSKAFAMTGWRLGYIGAPLWIAKACTKIQGQCTSGANAIAQRAAIAALSADPAVIAPMREKFVQRRELVMEALEKIDDLSCERPDGAFYVMPNVSAYFGRHYKGKRIENAADLSTLLLEEALVAVVSGEGFGAPDRIRISYATSNALLTEALARITKFLNKLE